MLTYNHSVLTNNGSWLTDGSVTPPCPTFDSVTIGSQIWMSKNLTIDDGQGGINTGNVTYGNNTVTEYYYTQAAALRVAVSIQGWHVPSVDEYKALFSYVGSLKAGVKLKSTYGWKDNGNGTDDYGFTLLPAGYYVSSVTNANSLVYMLTSDSANNEPYSYQFSYQTNRGYLSNQGGIQFVVRLIKD